MIVNKSLFLLDEIFLPNQAEELIRKNKRME